MRPVISRRADTTTVKSIMFQESGEGGLGWVRLGLVWARVGRVGAGRRMPDACARKVGRQQLTRMRMCEQGGAYLTSTCTFEVSSFREVKALGHDLQQTLEREKPSTKLVGLVHEDVAPPAVEHLHIADLG